MMDVQPAFSIPERPMTDGLTPLQKSDNVLQEKIRIPAVP